MSSAVEIYNEACLYCNEAWLIQASGMFSIPDWLSLRSYGGPQSYNLLNSQLHDDHAIVTIRL